jgi:hypothetical protein
MMGMARETMARQPASVGEGRAMDLVSMVMLWESGQGWR